MIPLSCHILPPFHWTYHTPLLVWFHIRHTGRHPRGNWNTGSIRYSFCHPSDDVQQEAAFVDPHSREMAGSGSCHSQCVSSASAYLLSRRCLQRSRGMPLIILIRMSSLVPWAWSNSLFAVSFSIASNLDLMPSQQSISSVSLLQFFIATCFVVPRVVIQVFIGSRVARLSNNKQRNRNMTRKNS